MIRRTASLSLALVAALVAGRPFPAEAGVIGSRIYPAPHAPLSLDKLPDGAALMSVHTADGLTLQGIELAPRGDRPVLLILHGNGSSAADAVRWFAPLVEQGYGVVAAEYRGYSANPGKPDEAGLAADADAFYARAKTMAGDGRRVIVVGHSLGGGVAFGLAKRQRLDALVTIGTFSKLSVMVPGIARGFVSDRYDNVDAVPGLDEPWFLVHGLRDRTVPASEGNTLHNAAVRAKRVGASFVLTDADHHPDGQEMATVIAAIMMKLDSGAFPTDLPPTIQVYPFSN